MVTETERRPPPAAELDVEEEIDVRRYWSLIVARWWLLAAGVVGGLLIGYLLAAGGGQVYKSTALIYMGQPLAAGGPIQSLGTNPNTVSEIIHSEQAISRAAAASGLRPSQLRGHVTTQTIQGPKTAVKANQVPLIEITVTGGKRAKTAVAAAALAKEVIRQVSGYAETKVRTYSSVGQSIKRQLASVKQRVARLDTALRNSSDLSTIEQLVLSGQLDNAIARQGDLLQAQAVNQQQLAQATDIEMPRIVEHPRPVKTTARSTRNSMLVGAFIGLLLGIIAALVWEPLTRRFGRSNGS
jgi:uncharacterized protein involved in exopolysaccharide biosynthesis